MQIRLLCENLASDMVWQAEWGFSALIDHKGTRILFDTGYSDVYWKNAEIAGIDMESVDMLALSHFHRDHTRGLLHHQFKSRKKLVTHPRVLNAILPSDKPNIREDYLNIHQVLRNDFDLITPTQATEIAPDAFFLGEIPRVTSFEPGAFFDDPMEDDTALAFRTEKGAVVVTGCSHAGICNISEHAKNVTGQKLHAVIGGFHLMHDENPPVQETIDYFKAQAIPVLLPMHCIDFEYQVALHNALGTERRGSGDVIEL